MKRTYLYSVLASLILSGLLFISWRGTEELQEYRAHLNHRDLPAGVNDLFAGSGKCSGCHGYDPQTIASVDANGMDINVSDDWRSTMMANSAKDPFWRAKVSHELIINPSKSADIQTKCTSCHAPLGHFNAKHNGQIDYALVEMDSDSIALDGVSCSACHQLNMDEAGNNFSGNLVYDTTKTIWGPYSNPFASPMQSLVGFNVVYEPRISESEGCAGCHTLITETVDLAGNYTGDYFVEQATYHEWLNSQYSSGPTQRECASCHLPRTDDYVVLALDYGFVGGRSPFGKHHLAGGNVFMLNILKGNIDSLGIEATTAQFDSTIKRSLDLLQDSSINLTVNLETIGNDTAYYKVGIENLTGHKLPSGYPSRRMFVQFTVMDDQGDTLFSSGKWDQNYEVVGHDPNYEQHYNTIRQEDEVQIYEMVFGDVNLDRTTVLLRGYQSLKDNRLPPKGFTSTHFAYDTTQVFGFALNDGDFNKIGGVEGSGADSLFYHVALNGYTGNLNMVCRVYYQTAPPGWMTEMFAESSMEIDRFRDMFDNANREPILMKQVIQGDLYSEIIEREKIHLSLYPNPTSDFVQIKGVPSQMVSHVDLFTMSGRLVSTQGQAEKYRLDLPAGTYLMRITLSTGKSVTRRVVKL